MGEIFIWRKSIQKKKGRCPVCGALVVDLKTGYPTDNAGVDGEKVSAKENVIWCASCHRNKTGTILGTVKTVSDGIIDASRMYDGIDWNKAEKMIAKDIKQKEKKYKTVAELEQKVRQLEFQNGMLQGSLNQQKTIHTNEIQERDNRIQALSKELQELEHRFDEISKNMICGSENYGD